MSAIPIATDAPDVRAPLSPRMRMLTILRENLLSIQQRADCTDMVMGKMIVECVEIVDDGMRDALQEQRADLSSQLSQSVRLAGVERQVRTIREHLGISA